MGNVLALFIDNFYQMSLSISPETTREALDLNMIFLQTYCTVVTKSVGGV